MAGNPFPVVDARYTTSRAEILFLTRYIIAKRLDAPPALSGCHHCWLSEHLVSSVQSHV